MSVVYLSDLWGFDSVTTFCTKMLDTTSDAVLVVALAKRFNYDKLLRKAYRTLSSRAEPISVMEARRMGPDATAEIAQIREAQQKLSLTGKVATKGSIVNCCICGGNNANRYFDTESYYQCAPCNISYFFNATACSEFVRRRVDMEIDRICIPTP